MISSRQVHIDAVPSLIVPLMAFAFAGCGGGDGGGPPPDPITQLAITVEPANVVAGSPVSPAIEVTIQRASGATATDATDAVMIAIGTNPGGGTLSGTLTVNSVDGIAVFNDLSIDLVGTGYTLAVTSGTLIGATSQAFNVTPAAAASLEVAGITDPLTAGGTSGVTVTARDAFGNVATGYTGTVTFTEDDPHPGASVPADYTFLVGDAGVYTFAGGVSLITAGSRTITATDTVTGTITGGRTVTVVPGAPDHLVYGVAPRASETAGATWTAFTVRIEDAYDNPITVQVLEGR
jgi:hypothetical protein